MKKVIGIVGCCMVMMCVGMSAAYAGKGRCTVPVTVAQQARVAEPWGVSDFGDEWHSLRSFFDLLERPTFFRGMAYTGVDVVQTAESYVFEFDLPGIKKADIGIEVVDGRLRVSAERVSAWEDKNDDDYTYIVQTADRYAGISKSFSLPEDADAKNIVAAYEQGVLTITIPRIEKKDNVIRIDVQ